MITEDTFSPGVQIKVTVKGMKPTENTTMTVVIIGTGPFEGVQYVIAGAPGILVENRDVLALMLNAHEATVLA